MAGSTPKKDNVPAPISASALPAHLQGQGKTTKVGNIESSDLIIPRVKLLQAISPEVEAFDEAKAGEFWHTTLSQSFGASLRFIPIVIRKEYVLWAPRGDERGILARAPDGKKWDQPGAEFTVKPKNSPAEVKYKLGESVHENGMTEFGSSIPGSPNSPPAAALTFHMMAVFPDYPDIGPAIIINTRSQVKPMRDLLSKIEMRPVDHYLQCFKALVTTAKNGDGDVFKNFAYVADGYVDEEQAVQTKEMFEKYKDLAFRANDENEDTDDEAGGAGAPPKGKTDSNKF